MEDQQNPSSGGIATETGTGASDHPQSQTTGGAGTAAAPTGPRQAPTRGRQVDYMRNGVVLTATICGVSEERYGEVDLQYLDSRAPNASGGRGLADFAHDIGWSNTPAEGCWSWPVRV